jgi:hypothetical protein
MSLSPEVDLEDFVSRPEKVSAADIAAICQEAGMHAVRKNRLIFFFLVSKLNCLLIFFLYLTDAQFYLLTLKKDGNHM